MIDTFSAEADPAGPRGARILRWNVLGATDVQVSKAGDGSILHPGGVETTIALVPRGAVWRFLDDGSDQGSAWRESGFDDSAWRRGPAQLGYGENDEATSVGYGPIPTARFATTYFRHRFAVGDPLAGTSLMLRVAYDDGLVAYLNGAEVARFNVPAGEVPFDTYALGDNPDDGNVFHDVALDPALLLSGSNVLAVELHQSRPGSSDLSFDLALDRQEAGALGVSPSLDTGFILTATNLDGTSSAGVDLSPGGDTLFYLPLDEPTGSIPADAAGRITTAFSPANGVTFPNGAGEGLLFDGGRALLLSGASLEGIAARPGEGLTIGFWLQSGAGGPQEEVILDALGDGKGLRLSRTDVGDLQLALNGAGVLEIAGVGVFDSLWHHVVVSARAGDTSSPGILRLYIDGALVLSQPWDGGGFGTPGEWGLAGGLGGGMGFVGSLREIAAFDDAFSDDVVAAWYTGGVEARLQPRIDAFEALDPTLLLGEATILHWVAPNADSVSISPPLALVPGFEDRALVPSASDQTYTLTATNVFGTATATTSLSVGTPPQINAFTASPNPLPLGATAALSWDLLAADEARLDPGGIVLPGDSPGTEVSPQVGTRFTLSASNQYGTSTTELDLATSTDPIPGSWTLALFPDTQHYADSAVNAPIFTEITDWLVDNKQRRDIRFVTHVGDIVQNDLPIEWDRVGESLSRLDGKIPYGLALGNHDYQGNGVSRVSLFAEPARFGQGSAYRTQPSLGGSFHHPEDPPDRADSGFHTIEINGLKVLVMFLEYAPRDATLNWANEVVENHPDHLVILSVHIYLTDGGVLSGNPGAPSVPGGIDPVNGGANLWDKLVRHHANFAMVLCGHFIGQPQRLTTIGDAGNPVHQMFFNTQDEVGGGDGYIRLLEFSADGSRCVVKTHSPHRDALGMDAWRTDPENLFELQLAPPGVVLDADGDGMDDAWEEAHGLDPGDGADAFTDLDGDGISNRLEFAFARDPRIVETGELFTPTVVVEGDDQHLLLRYRQRSGVDIEIHGTSDLLVWTLENVSVEQRIDHGDGSETLTVRCAQAGEAGTRFVRGVLVN